MRSSSSRIARTRAAPVSSTANHAPSSYGSGAGVTRDELSGRTYVFQSGRHNEVNSVAVVPTFSSHHSHSHSHSHSRPAAAAAGHRISTLPPPPPSSSSTSRRRVKRSTTSRQSRAAASLSAGRSSTATSKYVVKGRPSDHVPVRRRSRDHTRSTASSRARSRSRSKSRGHRQSNHRIERHVVVRLDVEDDDDHDNDGVDDYETKANVTDDDDVPPPPPSSPPPPPPPSNSHSHNNRTHRPRRSSSGSSRRRRRRASSIIPPPPPPPTTDTQDVPPPPPPPPASTATSTTTHHHQFRAGDGYVDEMVETESEGEWSPGPVSDDEDARDRRLRAASRGRAKVRSSAAPAGGSPTPSALRACATKASFYLQSAAPTAALAGKGFVLFGNLQLMTQDEATELIQRHGGIVTPSITTHTSYVVIGGVDAIKRLSPRHGAAVAGGEPGMPPTLNEAGLLQLLSDTTRVTPGGDGGDGEKAPAPVRGRPRRRSSHWSTGSTSRSLSRARSPSSSGRYNPVKSLKGSSVLLYRSVPADQRGDWVDRIEAAGGKVTTHMGRADVCVTGPQRAGSPERRRSRTESASEVLPVLSLEELEDLAPPTPERPSVQHSSHSSMAGSQLLAEAAAGLPPTPPSSPPPTADPTSPPLSSPIAGVLGWKGPDNSPTKTQMMKKKTTAATGPVVVTTSAPYTALEGWRVEGEEEQQQEDTKADAYSAVVSPHQRIAEETSKQAAAKRTPVAAAAAAAAPPTVATTTILTPNGAGILSPALSHASAAAVDGSKSARRPPISPQPRHRPPIPTGTATPPPPASPQLMFTVDGAPLVVPQYANLPALMVAVREGLGYHPSAALTLHRGDTIITHATQVMAGDVLRSQAHATQADAAAAVAAATANPQAKTGGQRPPRPSPAASPATPYSARTSPSMPSVRATPDSTSVASPHTDSVPTRAPASADTPDYSRRSQPPTPRVRPPATPVEDDAEEDLLNVSGITDDSRRSVEGVVSDLSEDGGVLSPLSGDNADDSFVSQPPSSPNRPLGAPMWIKEEKAVAVPDTRRSSTRPLSPDVYVLCGNFTRPRDEVQAAIFQFGGHVEASVSPRTRYVVVGMDVYGRPAHRSTEYRLALRMNIEVIDEAQLMGMVQSEASPLSTAASMGSSPTRSVSSFSRSPSRASSSYYSPSRASSRPKSRSHSHSRSRLSSSAGGPATISVDGDDVFDSADASVASADDQSTTVDAVVLSSTGLPGGPRTVVVGTGVGSPASPLRPARGASLSASLPPSTTNTSGVFRGATSPDRASTPGRHHRRRHTTSGPSSSSTPPGRRLLVATAVSPSKPPSVPPPAQPLVQL